MEEALEPINKILLESKFEQLSIIDFRALLPSHPLAP